MTPPIRRPGILTSVGDHEKRVRAIERSRPALPWVRRHFDYGTSFVTIPSHLDVLLENWSYTENDYPDTFDATDNFSVIVDDPGIYSITVVVNWTPNIEVGGGLITIHFGGDDADVYPFPVVGSLISWDGLDFGGAQTLTWIGPLQGGIRQIEDPLRPGKYVGTGVLVRVAQLTGSTVDIDFAYIEIVRLGSYVTVDPAIGGGSGGGAGAFCIGGCGSADYRCDTSGNGLFWWDPNFGVGTPACESNPGGSWLVVATYQDGRYSLVGVGGTRNGEGISCGPGGSYVDPSC